MWRCAPCHRVWLCRPPAAPSRGHGIGARLKYSARWLASATTLTTFGSRKSASEVTGVESVAMSACGYCSRSSATCLTSCGGSSGSSPWTLTTICPSFQPRVRATSATRSVPEAWLAEVMITALAGAPKARAPATMRSSSVAISTSPACAAPACSYTHCSIDLPAMRSSGLPGSRVDAWRAGITTLYMANVRAADQSAPAGARPPRASPVCRRAPETPAGRHGK